MPKKQIIHHDKLKLERPHRKMKAKIVYDPSDTHTPKKRNKYSKQNTTRSKSCSQGLLADVGTKSTELLDYMQTEQLETSKKCFICSEIPGDTELIDCPICFIIAHRDCLIVNEPVWKLKLDLCPWFCKQCRKQNCAKCLKDESQLKIQCRCITCGVGLHEICYESYEIKPLQKLENGMYICIACLNLATQINSEEEEEAEKEDIVEAVVDVDYHVESCSSRFVSISPDEDNNNSKSNRSYSSSDSEKYNELQNNEIPNISKWTRNQVFGYLTEILPQKIIDQINKYDIDGGILLSLERTTIISNMGLKLGHALAFYKQVRILQTQSTSTKIYWD